MRKNAQTEVLVVGAGPVGMLAALLLTQQGLRIRIIDQEARTAAHSYACALHPGSLRLLERAGIVEDVIALGRRVETVGLYEGAARRAQAILADLPNRYPFAVVLAQFLLEELLEERLRAAGVQVEWHSRLREMEPGAEGVIATIEKLASSGRGYIIPELDTTVRERVGVEARFVIGADGCNSQVRRQLGIAMTPAGAPQSYGVFEIETAETVDHEMKLVLNESTISVLWPLADNRCRWSFQLVAPGAVSDFPRKERDHVIVVQAPSEEDSLHQLRRFLTERAPWFRTEIKDILWIAHAQFQRQLALRFGEGRCWLAGDAAHQASPAGMQSMNQGLNEAADLADAIKSILRDQSSLGLLQSYDHAHQAEWQRLLGLTTPAEPPISLSPWARQHFSTILGNLPASGEDLNHLLEKL